MQGFKEFIMRGNVIELAVAVVIGTAFTAIVTAIVQGLITPVIAAMFNAAAIEKATTTVGNVELGTGAVLAAVINFLLIALVVYLVLVLPMAKLKEAEARRKGITEEEAAETEYEVLNDIRDLLRAQQGTPPAA